jgi:DNA-binding FadR family transcriptional regulator
MQCVTKKGKMRPVVSNSVRDYIKNYILDQGLQPGDVLIPEGQIASDMGVGRSSVREAVKSLESLGILEVKHGAGLYVREMNFDALMEVLSYNASLEPSTLLELLSIRELIEINKIQEVTQKIQPDELDSCQKILDEWKAKLSADLPYNDQDRLFHQTLHRVLGSRLLVNLTDAFWIVYRKAEERTIPACRSGWSILEYHQEILNAVKERNAELAKNLMDEHFQEIEERLKMALENPEMAKLYALQEHLVLFYDFDEDAGNVVKDLSGKGNDGEIVTAKWVPDGKFKGCLEFDGKTDYIQIPHHHSLNPDTDQITAMAWYKPFSFTDDTEYPPIVRKGSVLESCWGLDISGNNMRGFIYPAPGNYVIATGKSPMSLGEWHHLAMVYNGQEIRLYFNGELDSSIQTSAGINKNESLLWIGKKADESIYLQGAIDDLAVMNIALTEVEIKKYMKEGVRSAIKLSNETK